MVCTYIGEEASGWEYADDPRRGGVVQGSGLLIQLAHVADEFPPKSHINPDFFFHLDWVTLVTYQPSFPTEIQILSLVAKRRVRKEAFGFQELTAKPVKVQHMFQVLEFLFY